MVQIQSIKEHNLSTKVHNLGSSGNPTGENPDEMRDQGTNREEEVGFIGGRNQMLMWNAEMTRQSPG